LCVLCDNRVPSEQSDEAEKEEDKTPDVRNATQSEDGAAPVILAVTLGVGVVKVVIGFGVIPAPAVASA
jgi:ribosomal protein S12 methylthiotransferase accessory factor YcaO